MISPLTSIASRKELAMFKQKTIEETLTASRVEGTSKGAFYNNPRYRALFYQVLMMAGLLYFFYSIISNTLGNMEGISNLAGKTALECNFDAALLIFTRFLVWEFPAPPVAKCSRLASSFEIDPRRMIQWSVFILCH